MKRSEQLRKVADRLEEAEKGYLDKGFSSSWEKTIDGLIAALCYLVEDLWP